MARFHYEPLLPGSDSIRLLRLMPSRDKNAPIQCQLFDYSLEGSGQQRHLYEALSYVWGDWTCAKSILVNNQPLLVTANLHAALLQLRNSYLERILWVDAISINQEDLKERGHQVQLMAKIYANASSVIVWLGDLANGSDRAFKDIATAAEKQVPYSPPDLGSLVRIRSLVERPWFRRIWVR